MTIINIRALRMMVIPVFTLVLFACAVGPDYKRPSVVVPTKFKEAKGNKEWKVAQPRDTQDRGAWWKVFHDQELNKLEAQLTITNQTILAAAANYQQANALVDEASASFFPTMVGEFTFTRKRQGSGSTPFISTSSTGSTSVGTATAGGNGQISSNITNSHSIVFSSSWEPDIWGLVRRTVEASEASAEATGALLASARLSAQGSLAQFYFELRALDTDQKILNDTVASYKQALKLTKYQYASGVAAQADVVQAQSLLETTQAQAINVGVNRAVYEHAIAVLMGMPPAEVSLRPRPLKSLPPPIPLVFPAALLERRPDIAQNERLMAQANAQIGVAVAAYYPSLSLSASASFFGSGITNSLMSRPALGWAWGPQLSQLLYDGGLRAATVKAAEAGYRSTVATYRQTVLAAFQNVEDNLATLRILKDQAVVQNQAADSAKLALKLVINQYKAGTVPYSSVITAEIAAFNAEKAAADLTGLRMNAAVGLILALGGGWDARSVCS